MIQPNQNQYLHSYPNATSIGRRLIGYLIVVFPLLLLLSWFHSSSNINRVDIFNNNNGDNGSFISKDKLEVTSAATSATAFPERNLVLDLMQLCVDIFGMEEKSSPADAITNPKYKLELFIKANFSTRAMVVSAEHGMDVDVDLDLDVDVGTDSDTNSEFGKYVDVYGRHSNRNRNRNRDDYHSRDLHLNLKNNTRKTCIVVYKGSDAIDDWLVDINVKLEKSRFVNAPDDVMVHKGFQDALFEQNITSIVENKVLEIIGEDGDGEVLLAGHSLGGANSHITGAFLADKYPNMKVTVINFGSPRLGNDGFKAWTEQKLPNLSVWRFVYRADIVPRMIPRSIGYKHAGHLFMMYESDSKIYYHQTGLMGVYQGAPWNWYYASSYKMHPHPIYLKHIQDVMNLDQFWPANFESSLLSRIVSLLTDTVKIFSLYSL